MKLLSLLLVDVILLFCISSSFFWNFYYNKTKWGKNIGKHKHTVLYEHIYYLIVENM